MSFVPVRVKTDSRPNEHWPEYQWKVVPSNDPSASDPKVAMTEEDKEWQRTAHSGKTGSIPPNTSSLSKTYYGEIKASRRKLDTIGPAVVKLVTFGRSHFIYGAITSKQHAYGPHKREVMTEYTSTLHLDKNKAPLIYIHGGGFAFGNPFLWKRSLQPIYGSGRRVFNVKYPVAPEDPFPRPLHSMINLLNYVRTLGHESVFIAGDSAGGNLTSWATLLTSNPDLRQAFFGAESPYAAPDLVFPEVKGVGLIYGSFDRFSSTASFPGSQKYMNAYAGPDWETKEGLPLRVSFQLMDWAWDKFPRAFMGVGTKDTLAPSTRMMHTRLTSLVEAGGCPKVDLISYPDQVHGFFAKPFGATKQVKALQADLIEFMDKEEGHQWSSPPLQPGFGLFQENA